MLWTVAPMGITNVFKTVALNPHCTDVFYYLIIYWLSLWNYVLNFIRCLFWQATPLVDATIEYVCIRKKGCYI